MYMDHLHGIRIYYVAGKELYYVVEIKLFAILHHSQETVSLKENMQHQLSCLVILHHYLNIVFLLL